MELNKGYIQLLMSTIIIPKIKNFFIDEKADMAKHIDKKTQIYMGSERREPCMPGGSSKKSKPLCACEESQSVHK